MAKKINKPTNPPKKELKTQSKRDSNKFIHFLIGFFGVFVAAVILNLLFMGLGALFPYSYWITSVLTLGLLLGFVIAIIRLFKTKYKYVAIGMLAALIIPLLLFGACFIIIASIGF